MPGMRIKVRDRAARRKRRLVIGIPLALAVAAAGGLAFADVTPRSTPVNGTTSTSSNGVAMAPASAGVTAPNMMSNSALTANISVSTVKLASAFSYLSPSSNGIPTWTRTVTAVAPNGTLEVAWQAANSVHVTPVNRWMQRRGPDVVINGAREIGGLVAFNNGFTLLTRVSDHNRYGETAAALIRVANNRVVLFVKLTGSSSHDTSPVLNGQLTWNGSQYTAYFTVHSTSNSGQWGDKFVPVSSSGQMMSGGWEWGCRGNVGRSLSSGSNSYGTCWDDGTSGASKSSSLDQMATSNGQVVALSARGPVTWKKSNLTWSVNPLWKTNQVVIVFLSGSHWKHANSVWLTSDQTTQNLNVHIAPYGKNAMMVTWDSYRNGQWTGTHFRLIDSWGRFLTADLVLTIHVSGNIVVLSNGDLAWAFVQQSPAWYHGNGIWPTTTRLFLARLRVSFSGSSSPTSSPSWSASPTPSMMTSGAPSSSSSTNTGSHW
jgi:hypothetical protein